MKFGWICCILIPLEADFEIKNFLNILKYYFADMIRELLALHLSMIFVEINDLS